MHDIFFSNINSLQDIIQLPDVFLPKFVDTIKGLWIISDYLSTSLYPNFYKEPGKPKNPL